MCLDLDSRVECRILFIDLSESSHIVTNIGLGDDNQDLSHYHLNSVGKLTLRIKRALINEWWNNSPFQLGGTASGEATQVLTGVLDSSDPGPQAPWRAMVMQELSKDKVAYGKINARDLGFILTLYIIFQGILM